MISYKPLYHTLIDRNMNVDQLRKDGVISGITVSKFAKNQSITLTTAEKICKHLNCKIADIVEFID